MPGVMGQGTNRILKILTAAVVCLGRRRDLTVTKWSVANISVSLDCDTVGPASLPDPTPHERVGVTSLDGLGLDSDLTQTTSSGRP